MLSKNDFAWVFKWVRRLLVFHDQVQGYRDESGPSKVGKGTCQWAKWTITKAAPGPRISILSGPGTRFWSVDPCTKVYYASSLT